MKQRQSKGRLGAYLIETGHLSGSNLERALEIQRVAGGHLGTNLLEMGVVSEDTLLSAIGKLHENPTVSADRLLDVPREISAQVPRDLVRRHNIVPFAVHGNTVYIASQRPGDIHIENEVTLATSRLTRTFLGLEVRVQEALHRHHGHSLPLRFSRLLAKLAGTDTGDQSPEQSPTSRTAESRDSGAQTSASQTSASQLSAVGPSPSTAQETDTQGSTDLGAESPQLVLEASDGFDPTLSSTVGRRIVWKDFEIEDENARLLLEDPSLAPPSKPVDSEPASGGAETTASHDAVGEGPPSGEVRQFPVATQAEDSTLPPTKEDAGSTPRRSRPRTASPLAEVDADQTPAGSALVESLELDQVSSPDGDAVASLVDAHAALVEAANRESVGRILMEGLRPFFRRRLLLAKRGDQLIGWRADGPGVRPKDLAALRFPLNSGTPFLAIVNGSKFWLSAYHQDAAYDKIAAALGSQRAPDCMVLPLRAGQHIVGFFYGDNEGLTVTGQPIKDFLELSEAAGRAFERIIQRLRESRNGKAEVPNEPTAPPAEKVEEVDPWYSASESR